MVPRSVWEAGKAERQCVTGGLSRDHVTPIWMPGTRRCVGFYHPHDCVHGRRIGPLFVMPEHRGRGIARGVYASIKGPLVACVRDDNAPSIRLHEAAGFERWRRYASGWWWIRP